MRENNYHHPNNQCIVNVQLDKHRAEVFYRMKNATGMTVSEVLKAILNPVIDKFEKQMVESERKQAEQILFGVNDGEENEGRKQL